MSNEAKPASQCPFTNTNRNFTSTEYLDVKEEDIKPIPYKGGIALWNLMSYYRNGYLYFEELEKEYNSKIFNVKLNGDCIVIQDFKGIEVTYDVTKVDKKSGFGIASLNWNMVKDHKPSVYSNGYDHEVKKDACLQFDAYCRANLTIDKFVKLVQSQFEEMPTINNESSGFDIEESLEKIVGNILTTIYLGEIIDSNLLQKWLSKSLLFAGVPSFSWSSTERGIADEVFTRFQETPNIKRIREIVNTNLSDELLLSQIVWMTIFNGWGALSSFFVTELCCFMALPENQKNLMRKEANEFLASEKRSFEKLNSLHYINQFFLEAMRLHHPPARIYGVANNDFVLETSEGYYQIKKDDFICGNRWAAHRDEKLFENAESFSLERDLSVYDKYVKTYAGAFSEEATPTNHKCASQLTSMYILKMVLIFLTKCDIEVASSLTYTGSNMTRVRASDEPVKVSRFIYQE